MDHPLPETNADAVLLTQADGVATITLNHPERHNAFDDRLIADLTAAFIQVGADPTVRVVMLAAAGASFSAGADLGWMRRMADYSDAENLRDAEALATLMQTIAQCPKPVVALVQGAAIGGGVGLVAACDIAIASEKAQFCLSEVRLGLIPAVISPYVLAAMGERACRRYFLTAERFDAAVARTLGLIHKVVPADRLWSAGESFAATLRQNGPAAMAAAKALIRGVQHPAPEHSNPHAIAAWTARQIADIRASAEGREGVQAFLEKRAPAWQGE